MEFIREAGWPIYLVVAAGAASLAAAYACLSEPRRERAWVAIALAAATLGVGALGTVVGVQVSAKHLIELPPDERWIFAIGLKESLNNLSLALGIAVADALLLARAAWRRAQLPPG